MEVNKRQLCEILGYSSEGLLKWAAENPPLPIKYQGSPGVDSVYDTTAVVAWMCERSVRKAVAMSEKDRYYKVRREREELALNRDRARLVDIAVLKRELLGATMATRELLLQLPDRFAGATELVTGFEARRDMFKSEIEAALKTLSTYNPERDPDDPFGPPPVNELAA